MSHKRLFALFFALSLLFTAFVPQCMAETADNLTAEDAVQSDEATPDGTQDEPQEVEIFHAENGFAPIDDFSIAGSAALLYDLNSDMLLYGQNLDEKIYPASLAKILTCLVAIENGNLEDEVTVSATALENIDPDGTNVQLQTGEVMKLEDLLYCVMLASANEACNVVAEHIAGSVDAFVNMLNERAAELGCRDSHFANTHGLHDEEEYTTVRNLMYIAREALKNETFCKIAFTTKYEVPATNLHEARTLHTTNYMVSQDLSFKYYYDKAAGIKTGYTSKAGRCLISTAKSDDMYLLSIVTGCETTDMGNGEYHMHSFPESKRLFEYGFSNFECITVLSPLVPISEVGVNGGAHNSVVVAPVEDATLSLPYGYDPENITTEIQITGGAVQAPVSTGEVIGSVTLSYMGEELATVDIAPITDVAAGNSEYHPDAETTDEAPAIRKISIWKVLLILASLVLCAYLGLYIYLNIQRRKHKKRMIQKHKRGSTRRKRPHNRR